MPNFVTFSTLLKLYNLWKQDQQLPVGWQTDVKAYIQRKEALYQNLKPAKDALEQFKQAKKMAAMMLVEKI